MTASDRRLKNEIQNLSYGMREINLLRPVSFAWKGGGPNDRRQVGLIAQEVQLAIPELVESDARSGMLSVNYQALAPVLIRAIQEQQATIKRQEARITALERERTPVLSSSMTILALAVLLLGVVAGRRWRVQREG